MDKLGIDVLCCDTEVNTLLHVASLEVSLDVFKTEKHCSPMEKGPAGRVPLHDASQKGHLAVVKYFLDEQGVDVLCRDGDGNTPLHMASAGGSLDVIKYFITEKHCSPLEKGRAGRVPLHHASENGHLAVVKYFLDEQGVDVLCRDGYGNTPLHIASVGGSLDVIKYFITEKHCSPMEKGLAGRVPLHHASLVGHLAVVKYFLDEQGVDVLCRDGNGDTPLHMASAGGSLDVIKYFITEKHCSPMEKGLADRVPLHHASQKGHLAVVKYFLDEQGVDVLCRDGNGNTPLHMASFGGSLDVIKYFITKKHCSPMEKGRAGRVPLHDASQKGHLAVVKYFLDEQGVDVLCRDGDGNTPLHMASAGGSLDVIKYFITEKHCSPLEKGRAGRVPLHHASENGHLAVVKYFLDEQGVDVLCRDGYGNTPLHIASVGGSLDVIKYFITEKHCSPMEKGLADRVPLHHASQKGHLAIVKYFLDEQGVDVLCRDGDGNTPLHMASAGGSLDVIKYFIREKHCSPLEKGLAGRVPLHHASQKGHLAVVKYFIDEQGMDILFRDVGGKTPLHYACSNGHMDVVQYFVHEKNCNPLVSLKNDVSVHVTAKSFRNTPLALCFSKGHNAIGSYLFNKVSFGDNFFESNDLIRAVTEEDCVLSLSVKVYFGGHRSSGKSTLLKSVMDENSLFGRWLNVKGVPPNTAGIIPVEFVSEHFGKVTLYDFAGHEEYHGSHEAFFENTSHPVILIVVDLLMEDSHILQSLKYWLSLFVNGIMKAKTQASVIIVGSHSDLLSSAILPSKVSLLNDFVQLIKFSGIKCVGWIDIDCRKSYSSGMTKLRNHLRECCFRIRLKSDYDNRRQAYSLKQYLLCHHSHDKAITCGHLMDMIPESDDECLSSLKDRSCLYGACETLNTTGDIIFLKNKVKEESWIVLNKEEILSEVHGILKRIGSEISSTPGIIPLSLIASKTDSSPLVIEYMLKMEFCLQIDPEALSLIKGFSGVHSERHFIFPDLISDQRPDDVCIASSHSSYSFGWLLRCAGENIFTPRFLQVLLIRLTCKFALVPHNNNPPTLVTSKGCRLWKNGISWLDASYVEVTVEVLDMKTAVIVVLRCKKEIHSSVMQCVKLRSELIREVLSVKGDHVEAEEFLVHPKCLAVYQPPLEEVNLLPLSGVTRAMVSLNPSIVVDGVAGRHWLSLSELFLFEPFECFGEQILRDTFNPLNGDKGVSTSVLDAISNSAEKSWTYLATALNVDNFLVEELKIDDTKSNIAKYRMILECWSRGGRCYSELVQQLSNYSIFAERNPLV